MRHETEIVADVFESASGIPKALEGLGAKVPRARLVDGDYALPGNVLVERKRVDDLHTSLIAGRLWAQLGGLREACLYPFLLVEGPDLDAGPVSPAAIRGACLASIQLGIRLLRSDSSADSALWLYRLAIRRARTGERPAYAQTRQPRRPEACREAMLATVPGISTMTARALLERFGSVCAIGAADAIELQKVPGIGQRRATAVVAAFRAQTASRSEPRSERPGRAT